MERKTRIKQLRGVVMKDQFAKPPKSVAQSFISSAVLLLAAIGAFTSPAYSQGGVPLWTNRYPGRAGVAMAVDRSGHPFVTGSSRGTNGYWEYATVAYSSAGLPLWTNRYQEPGIYSSTPGAIAVDSNGNVFVTGESFLGSSFSEYA